jgi:hypothetical protein
VPSVHGSGLSPHTLDGPIPRFPSPSTGEGKGVGALVHQEPLALQ